MLAGWKISIYADASEGDARAKRFLAERKLVRTPRVTRNFR